MPWTRWPAIAGLLAVLAGNFYLKVRHSTGLPRYDPADETGYYNVESAFQYRYARMIAEGRPVPELDRDAQHPEGVRVWRELTMWMEYATAWSYRLLGRGTDFPWFVILWVSAVSSLSAAAFYAAALALTASPALALAGAAAYGLSWAAVSDLIGTYGFQCFALPLIFGSLACLLIALKPETRGRLAGAAAAALMFAALASWHVTRFYLAALFAAGFFAADRKSRGPWAVLIAGCAAAGLSLGVLRESRFLLSPTMLLGYGLLARLYLQPRRALAAWAVLALAAGLSGQASPESGSYGHVYAMLWEKLRHGLAKPADPALLSDEARLLWVGPFNSPDAAFLLFSALPLGLLAALRFAGKSAEGQTSAGRLVDMMTALTLLGTILIGRLLPFFCFFFCLWSIRRLPARPVYALAIAAVALLEGLKTRQPYSRLNPIMALSARFADLERLPPMAQASEAQALPWLRENAGPGKPVLAHFGVSGPVLAYTGSPVLLNPKLESASMRRKSLEYLKALYADEETFYRFCESNGAKFFLYAAGHVLDSSPEGTRYASGSLKLRQNAAALSFHFHPEKLKHFRLQYQNQDFRIFSVGEPGQAAKGRPLPVYDLAQFKPIPQQDGTLELDTQGAVARMRQSRLEVFKARLLRRLGRPEAAVEAYERAFALWPPDEALLREARGQAPSPR